MRYFSYPQSPPGDEESKEIRKLRPREASVELKTAAVKSRIDNIKQQALQAVMFRYIRAGEELLVEYGIQF